MKSSPQTIEIPTGDECPVRGDLYVPRRHRAGGVVLLCHGFTGYKSWGFLPFLAGALQRAGLVALSLDMSHNGTFPDPDGAKTHGKTLYARPDLFAKNTLRREYEDVGHATRFVADGGLGRAVKGPVRIGLFGHSRGGITATLNAIDRPEVLALATWSTIDDPDRFTDRQKEQWRRDGVLAFAAADGTPLRIGVAHLDDLEENHEFYVLPERVAELAVPHLVVHGKADLAVPYASAIRIHEAEHHLRDKELLILQTGHTFGVGEAAGGSGDKPPRALTRAVDETVAWFGSHLREQPRK